MGPDTVLVTGGAGFVGATLVRRLVGAGYRVRILDDLSVGRAEHLEGSGAVLVRRPIGDAEAVAAALQDVRAVVHLAARPGIPASIADPLGTFRANVADLVSLLEAARIAGVDRFVLASSRAAGTVPGMEPVIPGSVSPYAAGKLSGEAFCRSYAATYGLATTSLRFSNVYGPWSAHKASVVAVWMRSVLDGRPLTIHGDGSQRRDFIFVDDVASAILNVLAARRADVSGATFAVDSGADRSILDLADAFDDVTGRELERERLPWRVGEGAPVSGSPSVPLAHPPGPARPATALEDGLGRTLAWYRQVASTPTLAPLLQVTTRTGDD